MATGPARSLVIVLVCRFVQQPVLDVATILRRDIGDQFSFSEEFDHVCDIDLLRDCGPIGRRPRSGHFFGCHHVNFRLTLIGKRYSDALAANVVELDVIFLLDALAQVLHGHVFLRQFDFQRPAFLLKLRQPPSLLAQSFFTRRDVCFLRLFLAQQFRRLPIHLLAFVLQLFNGERRSERKSRPVASYPCAGIPR